MTMRKAVTKQMAERYKKATKREKGVMLNELCALTRWSRRHAIRALAEAGKNKEVAKEHRGRPTVYGSEVIEPLRKIWATLDAPAGKRLAPFMGEILEVMERAGEIEVEPQVREKLEKISAATIDRLLAPERKRLQIKGRSGTKPGSILKRQIPIRTFADWDDARPRHLAARAPSRAPR